jgi:hypothetical protein
MSAIWMKRQKISFNWQSQLSNKNYIAFNPTITKELHKIVQMTLVFTTVRIIGALAYMQ